MNPEQHQARQLPFPSGGLQYYNTIAQALTGPGRILKATARGAYARDMGLGNYDHSLAPGDL